MRRWITDGFGKNRILHLQKVEITAMLLDRLKNTAQNTNPADVWASSENRYE